MRTIDLEDFKRDFEALVDEAAAGNPFIISVDAKPSCVVSAIDGPEEIDPRVDQVE